MSLIIMPTEPPSTPNGSSSQSLAPGWPLSIYRRMSGSRSPSRRPSTAQTEGFLVPSLASRSTNNSKESRSTNSNESRRRRSFRDLVNGRRSSSNVSLEEGLRVSDFEAAINWRDGFQRYSRLVTIFVSSDASYPEQQFLKICEILTRECEGHFLHSLPEAVFDYALLWCPAGPTSRNKENGEPSWSWTGWDGPVNFPFDPTSCSDLWGKKGEWFRSEIAQFHIGDPSNLYTVRREIKERESLRIKYPSDFQPPRGDDRTTESRTLRFTALTASADKFDLENRIHEGKPIPCSDITDGMGRRCGVLMEFQDYLVAHNSTASFEFVLVSRNVRCKPSFHTEQLNSTDHPPGTPIWDGGKFLWEEEVGDFDEKVFAPGPWKMLNVMLIKWYEGYAERVTVGRIHEDAWVALNPVKKDVVLR